jgi:hypothetical protein
MVSPFFLGLDKALEKQVEYMWLKSQLDISNYTRRRIYLLERGLDSKLQHCGLSKSFWKKIKNFTFRL